MTVPVQLVSRRRQTGVFAIIAAPVFWVGQLFVGLANQASFFSMEEYLQQPMWTADVPALINGPLLLSTFVFGLAALGLGVAGLAGAPLLFLSFRPKLLFGFCLVIFVAVPANLVIYESLASLGYYMARHRMPEQYGGSVQVWAVTVAVLASAAFQFWRCGHRLTTTG